MKMNKILIADDHQLIINALTTLLHKNKYEIIATANDGFTAYNLLIKHKPDIAIIDIEIPKLNGLEVTRLCRKEKISTKIIILTSHKERILYEKAKDLDVYGYLLKEFANEEIITCIQQVSKGKTFFSQELKKYIGEINSKTELIQNLTKTEIKVLKLVTCKLTNEQISTKLFISIRTVEKHRSNIIKKLHLEKKHNSLLIWSQNNIDKINTLI